MRLGYSVESKVTEPLRDIVPSPVWAWRLLRDIPADAYGVYEAINENG